MNALVSAAALATATPVLATAAPPAPELDPMFAAIERYREWDADYQRGLRELDTGARADAPDHDKREVALHAMWHEESWRLIDSAPTTPQGLAALVRFVGEHEQVGEDWPGEWKPTFYKLIAEVAETFEQARHPVGLRPATESKSLAAGDRKLVALGEELDRRFAVAEQIDREGKPLEERLQATSDELARLLGRDLTPEEWYAIRRHVGYDAFADRYNDARESVDEITEAIRAIPPRTFAGLLVWLKATAFDCNVLGKLDGLEADMDWDARSFHRLMREVERMGQIVGDKMGRLPNCSGA